MAALAGILIGCAGKLTGVFITVAVDAARKLHLEDCVRALRYVALLALHGCMLALQRIRSRSVLLQPECRWLESIHRVAGGAFAAFPSLGELTAMRIGLVTVGAFVEDQLLGEICSRMALHAIHLGMLPEEREFGFGMVERLIHGGCRYSSPPRCAVTRIATLLEAAAMGIGMAT